MLPAGFHDHFGSDDAENDESNQVFLTRKHRLQGASQPVPGKGKHHVCKRECNGGLKGDARFNQPGNRAVGDGDGETIHRQTQRQQKKNECVHESGVYCKDTRFTPFPAPR